MLQARLETKIVIFNTTITKKIRRIMHSGWYISQKRRVDWRRWGRQPGIFRWNDDHQSESGWVIKHSLISKFNRGCFCGPASVSRKGILWLNTHKLVIIVLQFNPLMTATISSYSTFVFGLFTGCFLCLILLEFS